MKASAALLPFLACLPLFGCSSNPPSPKNAFTIQSGLSVVLQWDAPVDLDLYVTDPVGETVYFDKRALRSGAQLQRDARCPAPGSLEAGAEIVATERPMPGRYRVGVDFSDSCTLSKDRAVEFRVRARLGSSAEEITGIAHLQRFNGAVLEFDVSNDQLALTRLPPSRQPTTVLPQARRTK